MIENSLPWEGMAESSKRRVALIKNHNVFWIMDLDGKYGLYIQSELPFESIDQQINLKNITLIKRNSSQGNGELIIFLSKKEDAQIFYRVCDDLIATINQSDHDDEMINSVEIRLNKWQELLQRARNESMSIELQMGLFSELSFMKEKLIPKIGIEQAIISWVGPDFDRQDFLLATTVVEIKSYRTSRGQLVNISSAQQLYSEKHPLFLVSYGLSRSNEKGLSINHLVEEIIHYIGTSTKIAELFALKLTDYGYIPELQSEPYASFIIDSCKAFTISNEFPKIPLSIPSEIVKLSYTLDLSRCGRFETNIDHTF